MAEDQTLGREDPVAALSRTPVPRVYRTSWRRFWASMIDGVILWPFNLGDKYFLSADRTLWTILLWGSVSYSVYWVYSVLMHATFGQTIGKMFAGVQVLDLSESRIPTLKQALLRESPYVAASFASLVYFFTLAIAGTYSPKALLEGPGMLIAWASLLWLLLELITMLTNEKRRALHDLLAGTVVVRSNSGE